MKSYFEENSKTHIMKTRCPEQFDITFAHKQRLVNSPILHMQRILNKEAQNEGKHI